MIRMTETPKMEKGGGGLRQRQNENWDEGISHAAMCENIEN